MSRSSSPSQEADESQLIWNGEVSVTLSKSHRYSVVDRKAKVKPRGVTTAIAIMDKPQLITWAVGEGLDYVYENRAFIADPQIWVNAQQASEGKKGEAASIGDAIHKWCDQYIRRSFSGWKSIRFAS
jgi:2,4-dienoyl-CoA reductase-like NADH-dependent reductase (Old Yellow Enzyme family)